MITRIELEKIHKIVCEKALQIAIERGDEYSNNTDELRTFRLTGQLFGCEPSDVAKMQVCLKVARLKNDGKIDTGLDLINYVIYMLILKTEEICKRRMVERE